MNQLYKGLLAIIIVSCVTLSASAQQDYWSARSQGSVVSTDKAVARQSFPKEFKVLALDIAPLKQQLFSIVDRSASRSTVITLPDANGGFEKFRVYEASNFEPALQAKYPEIRAYSGSSMNDPGSTLKLSISPQGIQTMVFRTNGRPNEYIEPYSADHTVYAVFKSQRQKGGLPWVCSTVDQEMAQGLNNRVYSNVTESSAGELKTMRLAQSCNGEYANWFGATSVAQEALVMAAFNATMTRTNGCYEKDLAVHLNLIANTTQVIYYNPTTDPYTTLPNWNLQLQQTLTNIIGSPNYDIGHMFGASGGGGNAGCIGCVCVDPPTPNSLAKGAGITSPADGIPQGDNFDIDYVAHEVGHQLGGNHTFSFSNEGTGSNKEVGSGITIMGYAGITSFDVAPHSIDIFHERSIEQIQNNLATKTCPVTTPLAGVNATPVIAPLANYTIPISTPFLLTGSATDADGDPITYCWEQNDAGGAGSTGASSVAFPTKANGPNWLSFSPTTSPSRLCPKLSTILAGLNVTPPLPGGDAIANIEALSSISRALNFRLTVRDNHPYSSTPPLAVGQTSFMDMTVTVTNTAGPFEITSPNTPVSWAGGSTQTVTWAVNNTNNAPVSVSTVNILLSTDGGQTFPTVLATGTANDGTETITIPNSPTNTARIKVEAVGNIFFDINNANLIITVPPNGFTFTTPPPAVSSCPAPASMSITLGVVQVGTFNGPVNMTASGNPAGTTVSIVPNDITPGNNTVVTLNGTNTLSFGSYTITITGTSAGFPNATRDLVYTINPGAAPVITVQPANQTVCANNPANFSVTATGATSYQWQVSTIAVPGFVNIAGANAATYNIPTATTGMTGNQYRVIVSSQCGTVTSNAATLTVNTAPAISTHPQNATICTGNNNTFSVTATGTNLTYQWELNSGAGYNPIAGATSSSYTVNNATLAMNGYSYRVVISGACPPVLTSNAATLTVTQAPAITSQPVDASVCVPPNATTGFAVTATGASTYAWEVSTSGAGGPWIAVTNGGVYSGATTSSLLLTGVTITMNGYRYRALVSNASCPAVISNSALLTVNEIPSISGQPQNATICAGSNNTFSVSAAGSGLSYQWQVSTIAIPGFTNIPGANATSYTVNAATVGMNGNQYRVVINGACPPAITSAPAVLNVVAPPAITTQPANDAVCETGNISFSVVATGTTQYQWQVSTNGGTSWTDIAGATTSTLSLTNVSTSMDGYMYRVQLRNGTCISPVSSNAATLTVNNRPTVTIAASPYTALLPGRQTTITATLVPASTAFNITWKRNNVVIPGATTNTYIANVTKLGNYQVEILDPITGCNNTSNILSIRDSASTKLFVFPSPNNGRFTVSYHNPPGTPTSQTLAIYDSKGQKVYHRKLNVNGPYELHDINLTTSTGGIYYVVLGDPTGKVLADAKVLIAH